MLSVWQIVFKFIKWTWKVFNFIRNLIMGLFFIFLSTVCIYCLIHFKNVNHNSPYNSALLLDITGIIVDRPSISKRLESIGDQLLGINPSQQENSLFDIIDLIRQAKEDHNITGIILDLKRFDGADQVSMQYIGKALKEFCNTGKPVIAIGNNFTQCQYYLASFANNIWLSPHGEIDLHGFSNNTMYYKTLLNKLKVTTHVFRIGTYKSAVEPFIRDNMSKTARKSDSYWINELWNNYLSTIATNRKISKKQLFPGIHEMLKQLKDVNGDTAKYALNNNLVDALYSNSETEKALIKKFGWDKHNKSYRAVSMYHYLNKRESTTLENSIATIFVDGIIMEGEKTTSGNIGCDSIVEQIRNARLDPKVKAIILRVNSPGGSVYASELIRSELEATRNIGKPIVVSMGGVAASGGYWISTPANCIVADPNTITGSIGIFGIINTIEGTLDHIGIHTDGVTTSPLADVNITKALPMEVSQMMQLRVENGYKRFLSLVAESRKKTLKQVDLVAQGHIWTGKSAKDYGLIDVLGDFDDAINLAAKLAKLKSWNVIFYQNESFFNKVIINKLFNWITLTMSLDVFQKCTHVPMYVIRNEMIETNKITSFNDPNHCYAICLTCNLC